MCRMQNSQMNIQWNTYDVPRFQRYTVSQVWTYLLRDLLKAINTIFVEILKLRVCTGNIQEFPNVYPVKLLWCPRFPMTPCYPVMDIPTLRSFKDNQIPFLQKSLNYIYLQDRQKNSQMNIQWNSYDDPRFQRHHIPWHGRTNSEIFERQ